MRKLTGIIILLAAALILVGASAVHAQTSNRVWYAIYNGVPNPSSDVAIQTILTDGSANPLPTGSASAFVAQTNFTAFNSPYDIAVDPAMGKAYVLDNNVQGETPEYIYSFNLTGTPAQIAASARIIYTMPVAAADISAGVYPLISGLALDPINHYLYFNQTDLTTATNSYLGRLDLATSSESDLDSSAATKPGGTCLFTLVKSLTRARSVLMPPMSIWGPSAAAPAIPASMLRLVMAAVPSWKSSPARPAILPSVMAL